mmetsp:Transcript_22648/g.72652  ORF Transcript_22648/g.72652 Transcript_22648/m.72652 type:complete len:244 (-) Transcript_22648:71-802(-)
MPARSALLALAAAAQACPASAATLDARRTLSRAEARRVYDGFARRGHIGGRDASGGYGGPAVEALLSMAAFADAESCVEFGCGQAKLANLVLAEHPSLRWSAVDQSPEMVALARAAMRPHGRRFAVALTGGEPPCPSAWTASSRRTYSTCCPSGTCTPSSTPPSAPSIRRGGCSSSPASHGAGGTARVPPSPPSSGRPSTASALRRWGAAARSGCGPTSRPRAGGWSARSALSPRASLGWSAR